MTGDFLPIFFMLVLPVSASATPAWGTELHDHLAPTSGSTAIAITLDACGGAFDANLVDAPVRLRVPATVIVTNKWLDRSHVGTSTLLAHPDLFELEDQDDHGANERRHVAVHAGDAGLGENCRQRRGDSRPQRIDEPA
jgi:peptidoglycan/xylan/chitin deacetylase (PgdA/CDA1 family)